jgi:tetratricopeptide (TPR) repeat protein
MTNAECRMPKRALLACVLLSSFVIRHPSFAATPPLITEARQAIEEDIPEVAIEKLRRALTLLPVGGEERTAALALLAEAQLDTGRADAALDTLGQITPGDDARTVRLRALSLMALGRWDEALVQFQKLAARDTEKLAAFVGKAECLQSLGRTPAPVCLAARGSRQRGRSARPARFHASVARR